MSNKFNKKGLVLFLSFIILFFTITTSCSNQRKFDKVKYEGVLLDTINGNPVSGIKITLYACNARDGRNFCASFTVGSSVTDSKGNFSIIENSARSNRYAISISGSSGMGKQFTEQYDISENELKSKYSTIYLNY